MPGVAETFARSRRFVSRLMSDDLPTLDRPTNANSGTAHSGHEAASGALIWNSADLIFTDGGA